MTHLTTLWTLLGAAILSTHHVVQCHPAATIEDHLVNIPGDITLGGLFPLFVADKDGHCTVLNSLLGIPQLEALLFSIDHINANKTFLPNITLGVKAFDTCGNEMAALDRAVKGFVLGEGYVPGQPHASSSHVVGVVGPGYSYEAVHVSPFLGLFEIPLVSYGATSPVLSDKDRYKYFSRTIPEDSLQGRVIVEILKHFNWNYVSIVYSDEPYGRSGYDVIKAEAKRLRICFAVKKKLPNKYIASEYQKAVEKILEDKQARTVIIFCIESVILPFLNEVHRQNPQHQLQFIGPESFGMLRDWKEVRGIATGVIFTLPATEPVPAFIDYFYSLSIENNRRNPWFLKFFQDAANCTFYENSTELHGNSRAVQFCNTSATLRNINYRAHIGVFNPISFVMDSVYAFAHALQISRERTCGKFQGGDAAACLVPGNEFLKILRNSTFESLSGKTVNISDTGDVTGEYRIYQMDKGQHGNFENIEIGDWKHKLEFLAGSPKFHDVRSLCWETCDEGEVRHGVVGKPDCCSMCVACPSEAFVANETACEICGVGFKPDHERRICVPLEARYFTIDGQLVSYSLLLPPVIVSGLSIVLLVFTVLVFVRHNNTPLVKASARELSYLLIVGLFLSNLFTFVAILRPTSLTCFLQLLLDSLPFTICLVSIAVKNNRTFRIFNPNRNLAASLMLVNQRAQLIVSLALLSFQVILLTFLVVFEFPRAELIFPSTTAVHLVCIISTKQRYLAHLYNVLLLLVCTYYAYKTRHIPRNFNEAKYVAFAMYGVCVIFLAFFVVSMATPESDDAYQPTIICYRVTFTALFLFASVFAPKVYIIVCKPEENKRHSLTEANTAPTMVFELTPGSQNRYRNSCVSTVSEVREINDKSTQTE